MRHVNYTLTATRINHAKPEDKSCSAPMGAA